MTFGTPDITEFIYRIGRFDLKLCLTARMLKPANTRTM